MISHPSRRTILAAGAAIGTGAFSPALLHAQSRKYPVYGKVERLAPELDALIDADAVVEEIMGGFTWSEGPLWIGGADGMLLASDPRENVISSWSDSAGGKPWMKPSGYAGEPTPRLREPGSNGLFLGRGGLIMSDSGTRAIAHVDLKTKKKTIIVDRFEGKRLNSPNDLCVSPRDKSIYFTDPPYGLTDGPKSPDREMDYTGVFRIAPDNSVTLVGKYQMPNGIGISPDGGTLYHTDGNLGWIAHTLDANGNSVSERPFIDRQAQSFTGNSGDGFRVDQDGNLWVSGKDGISIVTSAGKRIGIIRLNDVVSNCEIGADGHLYMTSNKRLARVRVKARKLKV